MKLFFLMLVLLGSVARAAGIGFEVSEGYEIGARLESDRVWKVSGRVAVDHEAQKNQFLKLEANDPVSELQWTSGPIATKGVRFIDFKIKPAFTNENDSQNTLNIFGSMLGFTQSTDGSMEVAAIDGVADDKSLLVELGELDKSIQQYSWIRITVRQDLDLGSWDLFVNGHLAGINLRVDLETNPHIVFYGDKTSPVLIDDFGITTINPLFADTDSDGIPDAEELATGLNRYVNDRNTDRNRNGISNIEEFISGAFLASGQSTPNLQTATFFYVDNRNGSDLASGKSSYLLGLDGPKASIKSAMALANAGDTIVVLKGLGIYEEGSRGSNGKPLTFIFVDPVVIR